MTMQDRYIIVVKTMLGQGMPMTLKLIGACLLFSLLIGIVFGTIRSLKIPVVDQILGLYAVVCRGIPTTLRWYVARSSGSPCCPSLWWRVRI